MTTHPISENPTVRLTPTEHTRFDLSDPDVVAAYDELPLWSAPFGMLLLSTVIVRPQMTVLDFGCGTGFPLLELAQRLGSTSRVFGIDPWKEAVDRARKKASIFGVTNVRILRGRAEELPFENLTFDLIVSNNGINNAADPLQVLAECARTSRPGAQLVCTVNLSGTMAEFYTVFEHILRRMGQTAAVARMHEHIRNKRKPARFYAALFRKYGFVLRHTHEQSFTMRFADGTAFLHHAFIRMFFHGPWSDVIGPECDGVVFHNLEEKLNDYARREGELRFTIPIACFDCTKG